MSEYMYLNATADAGKNEVTYGAGKVEDLVKVFIFWINECRVTPERLDHADIFMFVSKKRVKPIASLSIIDGGGCVVAPTKYTRRLLK